MFASVIVSIALAVGIALTHSHATAPAHVGGVHIAAQDGSGGGPPTHP